MADESWEDRGVTGHRTGSQSDLGDFAPEGLPARKGLYDPRNEHDACGIGLIANIRNNKSHKIIEDGLAILRNLEHRGAVGADPEAGDGCGIMLQIPHEFFADEAVRLGFELPEPGNYGVGFLFRAQADYRLHGEDSRSRLYCVSRVAMP